MMARTVAGVIKMEKQVQILPRQKLYSNGGPCGLKEIAMPSDSSKPNNWQEQPLTALFPEAWRHLVELGAPLLRAEAEGRLLLAERTIEAFEQEYGTALIRWQRDGLPEDASIKMYEDFVEWSGWQDTLEKARQQILSLRLLEVSSLAPVSAG